MLDARLLNNTFRRKLLFGYFRNNLNDSQSKK